MTGISLLFRPLLRGLRLPPVAAIPDIDRELKQLAALRAAKLMKNPITGWPWGSILKLFQRAVAKDDLKTTAARFGNQSPYKR